MIFKRIPPARNGFPMGDRWLISASPVTRVVIKRPYWLAAFPTTKLQWRVGIEEFQAAGFPEWQKLSKLNPGFKGYYLPMENVNWTDCQTWMRCFARLPHVSKLLQQESGTLLRVRFPYEAEWEWACRAVQDGDANYLACTWDFNGVSHFGDDAPAMDHNGWFYDNSGGATHRVGEKAPNPLGLYDMHGNVNEWCMDRWVENYSQYWDGITIKELREVNAESSDGLRALRGGCWGYSAWWCRAAFRDRRVPDIRYVGQGFRVGLFPGPNRANASKTQVGSKLRREAETQREPTESPRAGFESMSMPPRSGKNF